MTTEDKAFLKIQTARSKHNYSISMPLAGRQYINRKVSHLNYSVRLSVQVWASCLQKVIFSIQKRNLYKLKTSILSVSLVLKKWVENIKSQVPCFWHSLTSDSCHILPPLLIDWVTLNTTAPDPALLTTSEGKCRVSCTQTLLMPPLSPEASADWPRKSEVWGLGKERWSNIDMMQTRTTIPHLLEVDKMRYKAKQDMGKSRISSVSRKTAPPSV